MFFIVMLRLVESIKLPFYVLSPLNGSENGGRSDYE